MSLQLVTSQEEVSVPMIELFNLDGESYKIPDAQQFNLQLKYMLKLREEGEMPAGAYLLTELIGLDGFKALSEYKGLQKEQFNQVVLAARKVVFGDVEDPDQQGKS